MVIRWHWNLWDSTVFRTGFFTFSVMDLAVCIWGFFKRYVRVVSGHDPPWLKHFRLLGVNAGVKLSQCLIFPAWAHFLIEIVDILSYCFYLKMDPPLYFSHKLFPPTSGKKLKVRALHSCVCVRHFYSSFHHKSSVPGLDPRKLILFFKNRSSNFGLNVSIRVLSIAGGAWSICVGTVDYIP